MNSAFAKTYPAVSKILAPTDLSPASAAASRYAMVLARQLGTSVELLYAYHADKTAASLIDVEAHMLEGVEQDFSAFAKTLEGDALAGVDVTRRTETVAADEAIEKISRLEGEHVKAVVMGTHGETALQAVFAGSTTQKVIRSTQHPVFAVPADYIGETVGPRRILWAVESDDAEEITDEDHYADWPNLRGISLVQELLRDPNSELTFFHAGDTNAVPIATLQELAGTTKYELATTNDDKHVADQIVATARRLLSDLIVVTHRERGFLAGLFASSVTSQALREAKVPVLVLQRRG